MSGTTLWEYVFVAAVLFALPLAMLLCALVAWNGVSTRLRAAGLALLAAGVVVIARQVLRTGVDDLMPAFAAPALLAVVVVYPLAAVSLVGSAAPGGRLSSPHMATALLAAASLVQFAAPWVLTSGK